MKISAKKTALLCACALLTASLLASCNSPTKENYKITTGTDLTIGVNTTGDNKTFKFTGEKENLPNAYEKFTESILDFSIDFLESAYTDKNTIISPIAMYDSLALVKNGSADSTEKELKKYLGDGVVSQSNINAGSDYLTQRLENFNTEKNYINIANSMWVANNIDVKRGFLEKNANYYENSIYNVDFSNNLVVEDINNWAKYETHNVIDDVAIEISPDSSVYLSNVVDINANFLNGYSKNNITTNTFTNLDKSTSNVNFMTSKERVVKTQEAVAFTKGLEDVPANFVAILPNDNLSVDEYISKYLSSQLDTLLGLTQTTQIINVSIPTFEIENSTNYKSILENMGMSSIFSDDANFRMLSESKSNITDISQSTKITFGANGITDTPTIQKEVAPILSERKTKEETIHFNRPFIFMVLDNESNSPLLIGTVNQVK